MKNHITIEIQNVDCFITGDFPMEEIDEALSFWPKGSFFKRKKGQSWDAKVHLLATPKKHPAHFPTGLLQKVCSILDEEKCIYEIKRLPRRVIDFQSFEIEGKTLRPYQRKAVLSMMQHKRGVVKIPTAGGKTVVAAACLKAFNLPCAYIVHTSTLLQQSIEAFEQVFPGDVGVVGGGRIDWKRITVCMVQTLASLIEKKQTTEFLNYQMLIVDECFVYDTLVFTNNGWEKIGDIADNLTSCYVLSYNFGSGALCWKKILRKYKIKKHEQLLQIKFNGGQIVCTKNHKFWTGNQYTKAGKLEIGSPLYTMWWNKKQRCGKVLPQLLERTTTNKQKSREICKTPQNDERTKPNDTTRSKRKNDSIKEITRRLVSSNTRRQWKRITRTTKNIIKTINQFYSRIPSPNKKGKRSFQESPDLLQNRYCQSSIKDSSGNRRSIPWNITRTYQGRKENSSSNLSRVEVLEIQEFRSDKQSPTCIKTDSYVYDLEIEDTHNYFANGILVSNCHHISSGKSASWYTAARQFKNAWVRFGMSATPTIKKSGLLLTGATGEQIVDVTMKDLQEEKYISDSSITFYQYQAPWLECKRNWLQVYKQGIIHCTQRNTLACEKAVEYAKQGLLVMLFVEHIEHGMILFRMLNELAPTLKTNFLSGLDDAAYVQRTKEEAKNKKLNILIVTRKLFGEGVDIPTIEVLGNAAGMESVVAFTQMFGRGLRLSEGKKELIYFDFIDKSHEWLEKHSAARIKHCKQLKQAVVIVENEKCTLENETSMTT